MGGRTGRGGDGLRECQVGMVWGGLALLLGALLGRPSAAPFCTIDTPEHHVTHPVYDPQGEDTPRLSGGRGPKPSL